jgi:hypothetical protein
MKRWIAIVALIASVVVVVPMAFSAAPPPPSAKQVAALAAQVRLLQKQTKVLQRRLANDEGELFANWSGDACSLALTADVLQGTWSVIDQISQATMGGKLFFGPQIALNDQGGCTNTTPPTGVTRQANQVPGSLSNFQTMISWIQP